MIIVDEVVIAPRRVADYPIATRPDPAPLIHATTRTEPAVVWVRARSTSGASFRVELLEDLGLERVSPAVLATLCGLGPSRDVCMAEVCEGLPRRPDRLRIRAGSVQLEAPYQTIKPEDALTAVADTVSCALPGPCLKKVRPYGCSLVWEDERRRRLILALDTERTAPVSFQVEAPQVYSSGVSTPPDARPGEERRIRTVSAGRGTVARMLMHFIDPSQVGRLERRAFVERTSALQPPTLSQGARMYHGLGDSAPEMMGLDSGAPPGAGRRRRTGPVTTEAGGFNLLSNDRRATPEVFSAVQQAAIGGVVNDLLTTRIVFDESGLNVYGETTRFPGEGLHGWCRSVFALSDALGGRT